MSALGLHDMLARLRTTKPESASVQASLDEVPVVVVSTDCCYEEGSSCKSSSDESSSDEEEQPEPTLSEVDPWEALITRSNASTAARASGGVMTHATLVKKDYTKAALERSAMAERKIVELKTSLGEEVSGHIGALELHDAVATDSPFCERGSAAATGCRPAVPTPVAEPVELSSEERHLVRWFRESHALAKDAVSTMSQMDNETYEWVDMPAHGVHTVEVPQARLREIGLVMTDGRPPTYDEPAKLYWIQDKPEDYKDKFGVWDPVGAQWRMYPKRTVVPVEQRIAPAGSGYGCDNSGVIVREKAEFSARHYGRDAMYDGTALEAGLPFILDQMEKLGADTLIGASSGWGSTDATGNRLYYTPQLRHVSIDTKVAEVAGKKYVYGWGDRRAVTPIAARATWNETNTCWIFDLGKDGTLLSGGHASSHTERERDGALRVGS